tara:strand:+ start:198 stop:557 length:360 start_codon:yes stop_codon:yes gene_type:complete
MDYYVNLLGNLGPIHDDVGANKTEEAKEDEEAEEEKAEPEIRTIVMCGCGNHPVNPRKDVYEQHNNWAAQFHSGMESVRTGIRGIRGIGKPSSSKPTYDFSGEDFEVTAEEVRKFNGKK